MARLATRTAKPDGQCCIPPEKVKCLNLIYLSPMRIGEIKESENLNEYRLCLGRETEKARNYHLWAAADYI